MMKTHPEVESGKSSVGYLGMILPLGGAQMRYRYKASSQIDNRIYVCFGHYNIFVHQI
jgi:hypothetical protein